MTGPAYRLALRGGARELRAEPRASCSRCPSTPRRCRSRASRAGRRRRSGRACRLAELARRAGRRRGRGAAFVRSLAAARRARQGDAERRTRSPIADALLALRVNGADLSPDHGYPARIIVPALPGVHNTKWVASIDFEAAA